MFDPKKWAGRVFVCSETGEQLTIPDDVTRGQFFSFGNSFVDVGDGYYSRFGGSPKEVKETDDAKP